MASIPVIQSDLRHQFFDRGGENAAKCYQCATCSSVCELAPANAPFPRRQVLLAQWGMFDQLVGDPGVWLCHQCNDCSVRCPRDVAPGDIMASLRAMVVELLAVPKALGSMVGNVKKTWPLLVFGPILFWIVLLGLTTGFAMHPPHSGHGPGPGEGLFFYDQFVPHILIYSVYFTAVGWVCFALGLSGLRFWKSMGEKQPRTGNFIAAFVGAVLDIALNRKFSTCDRGVFKRRWGHFLVMWGFLGAAITSGFAVVYLYKDTIFFSWLNLQYTYPVPITHWVKWLGNTSALLLVVGGILLFINRLTTGDNLIGKTTAFDRFFLWVILAVIGTGVFTEIFRFISVDPMVGFAVYIVHLGVVLCLFLTLPYSKFAHILYRTLAMTHERMTAGK